VEVVLDWVTEVIAAGNFSKRLVLAWDIIHVGQGQGRKVDHVVHLTGVER